MASPVDTAATVAEIPGLDFIAIDFETANPNHASVCQIGIARYRNGVVTHKATELVLPPEGHREFGFFNTRVHGLKPADVAGADGWEVMLPRLLKFAGDLPLVGHNVAVERSIINKASAAIGAPEPAFEYLCTQKLTQLHLTDAPSHKLNRLIEYLELPGFTHHDAGEDAIACGNVLVAVARLTGHHTLDALWPAQRRSRPRATR